MPIVTCQNPACGVEFEVTPGDLRAGKGKFCKKACCYAARRAAGELRRAKKIIPCACCGESFLPERSKVRYCSKSCSVKAQHDKARNAAEPRLCGYCNREFFPANYRARYCSHVCASKDAYLIRVRREEAMAVAVKAIDPVGFDYSLPHGYGGKLIPRWGFEAARRLQQGSLLEEIHV